MLGGGLLDAGMVSALGVTDTSRAMLDEEAFALATLLGEAPCTNCNTVTELAPRRR